MDEVYQTLRRTYLKTSINIILTRLNNIRHPTIVSNHYLFISSHIDDSHLRIHLLEYYKLK